MVVDEYPSRSWTDICPESGGNLCWSLALCLSLGCGGNMCWSLEFCLSPGCGGNMCYSLEFCLSPGCGGNLCWSLEFLSQEKMSTYMFVCLPAHLASSFESLKQVLHTIGRGTCAESMQLLCDTICCDQALWKWTTIGFCFILFYFILFYFISFYFISSRVYVLLLLSLLFRLLSFVKNNTILKHDSTFCTTPHPTNPITTAHSSTVTPFNALVDLSLLAPLGRVSSLGPRPAKSPRRCCCLHYGQIRSCNNKFKRG